MGVGDYWEDVDQYVRNQLTEQQITSADKLCQAVAAMPQQRKLKYIHEMTTDNVIERNVGVYLSDASNPTLVRAKNASMDNLLFRQLPLGALWGLGKYRSLSKRSGPD